MLGSLARSPTGCLLKVDWHMPCRLQAHLCSCSKMASRHWYTALAAALMCLGSAQGGSRSMLYGLADKLFWHIAWAQSNLAKSNTVSFASALRCVFSTLLNDAMTWHIVSCCCVSPACQARDAEGLDTSCLAAAYILLVRQQV